MGRKPKGWQRFFWLFFPAFIDFCASSLNFASLVIIPGSIYSMLNSLTPFIVAILSICMLNMDLYVHNYIAFLFVIAGSVLVTLAGVIDFTDGGESSSNAIEDTGVFIAALIVLIISILFTGLQLVVEEILY